MRNCFGLCQLCCACKSNRGGELSAWQSRQSVVRRGRWFDKYSRIYHGYQRERRSDSFLQDQHQRLFLQHQCVQNGLLPGQRSTLCRFHLTLRVASAKSAPLPNSQLYRPYRLRQLGRIRFLDRAKHGYFGSLFCSACAPGYW